MEDDSDRAKSLSREQLEVLKKEVIAAEMIDESDIFSEDTINEFDDMKIGPQPLARLTILEIYHDIYDNIDEAEEYAQAYIDTLREDSEDGNKDLNELRSFLIRYFTVKNSFRHIIQYYTMLFALLEEYCKQLLIECIIDEEYKEANETYKIFDRYMNQPTRENLLLRTGIIDHSTKQRLVRVRKARNRIIHDPRNQLLLEGIGDISVEIDVAMEVINNMFEMVNEDAVPVFLDDN